MFVAKMKDGSFFSLLDWKKREDIERMIKGELFYCPACDSTLRLKKGQVRKIHFAHINDSCKASSESETLYHLEGKAKLYESLLHYKKTTLEHYIPSTNQRADVFVETDNRQYAFEFQCSNLSQSEFNRRTKLYEREGIRPIWIIGKDKLGSMSQIIKLSPFQWRFLQRASPLNPPYILSFCPEKSLFFYLYPTFSFNSSTTYLTFMTHKNWIEQPVFQHFHSAPWKEHYLRYKLKWRYEYSLYKPYYKLRSFCYNKMKITLSLFPAEIGLPVPSFYQIHSPILEWQAWLYFDSIYQRQQSSIIHLPTVLKNFKARIKNSQIKVRDLPLVKGGSYEDAIVEYLDVLVVIGVLEKVTPVIYRKLKKERPYHSLEEALHQDRSQLEWLLRLKQFCN
ncbi:hypothetical protein AB685_09550 [Bacillus sp. LL01]|uniref:competence protein CoiA n=1 Tax=Bacillus sp. LL01 TaxID=1665556 RepID=UPI00064D5266|nr:competence protein CoiA family protein [Bacillus sp. LL01]KMJ58156.1 hypothetical protein AB685_09550 [Bacillus sp. LL01]